MDQPLLPQSDAETAIRRRIYVSHSFSSWNDRVWELGSVLYVYSAYPGSLLATSLYAIARAFLLMALASRIGHYVDTNNRLKVVRQSILIQRLVVILACFTFLLILVILPHFNLINEPLKRSMLAFAMLMGCIERLCATTNNISVERDWVAVLTQHNSKFRTQLNAELRRIDLLAKMIGPIFITSLYSISQTATLIIVILMSCVSPLFEYTAIKRVYDSAPELAAPNPVLDENPPSLLSAFQTFFNHPLKLASIGNAFLYITVLSFGVSTTAYLLSCGMAAALIGWVRGISVMFELSSTFIQPKLSRTVGARIAGVYFLLEESLSLVPLLFIFWFLTDSFYLCISVILLIPFSRVGLWGFSLCYHTLLQESVEPGERGLYNAADRAILGLFELISYLITVVWSNPTDFYIPVTISVLSVVTATVIYTVFATNTTVLANYD
ncbi:hypothetical protein CANCADRAFT_128305 [Tortispora caseinolytica NRRL Y-17796]|uniref:Solute carrier family 40 member n=1 Tax=Tortispora caseinolytica NRRL Y-17796 TaxID=767744 RepID=A0A1E4TAD5_9ASCO|nr:hypothetical protein CANCADRAFT_128305 [Tortispora caseinolytica NRRL Y-17796]